MRIQKTSKFIYTPPSDEQLTNFVSALTIGPGAREDQKRIVRDELNKQPEVKEGWLDYHKRLQMYALTRLA